MKEGGLGRALGQAGFAAAAALSAHTIWNLRKVHSVHPTTSGVNERVSILIPMRNEAHRLADAFTSVLHQRNLDDVEILVYDDESHDGTADVVRRIGAGDSRLRILDGSQTPLPEGWLGKNWACHRLSEEATGSVLAFLDADVVVQPSAVASAVRTLREQHWDLISPYPRQDALSWLERLTQPLVSWSWMTTMPMDLAQGDQPRWSAAIGQFLVVDTAAYRESGGHTETREKVIEDVEILRTLKRHGYRGVPMDGSPIAMCRMYEGPKDVFHGYTKSLWSAFGSTSGAVGGIAALGLIFVIPTILGAASRNPTTRRWGAAAYVAGTVGRVATARRTGTSVWPDAFLMPLSAAAFATLTAASVLRQKRGTAQWKGRSVVSVQSRREARSRTAIIGPDQIAS